MPEAFLVSLWVGAGDPPAGGPTIVGFDTSRYCPEWATREVTLDPFWIDATEVSNREYKAFVDATGHAAPVFWGGTYRTEWDELPVVGETRRAA